MFKHVQKPMGIVNDEDIDSFLNLMKVYQHQTLSLEIKKKANFFIAKDPKKGICGGAVIYKQNLSLMHKEIRDIFWSISPNEEWVWTSFPFFSLFREETYATYEELERCQTFYQLLLQNYIEFGQKNKLGVLCLNLHPIEYTQSKTYGCWPYLFEMGIKDKLCNKFQGILSLEWSQSRLLH